MTEIGLHSRLTRRKIFRVIGRGAIGLAGFSIPSDNPRPPSSSGEKRITVLESREKVQGPHYELPLSEEGRKSMIAKALRAQEILPGVLNPSFLRELIPQATSLEVPLDRLPSLTPEEIFDILVIHNKYDQDAAYWDIGDSIQEFYGLVIKPSQNTPYPFSELTFNSVYSKNSGRVENYAVIVNTSATSINGLIDILPQITVLPSIKSSDWKLLNDNGVTRKEASGNFSDGRAFQIQVYDNKIVIQVNKTFKR